MTAHPGDSGLRLKKGIDLHLAIITSSYPQDARDSKNAGVFVSDFARLVREREVECTVVTPQHVRRPFPPGVRIQRIPWPGTEVSLTHIDPARIGNILRLGALIVSGAAVSVTTIRSRRIDHILAMWAVPSGLFAWLAHRTSGVPYSVWVLGSDLWRIRDYPLGEAILRRVLTDARSLYANSNDLLAAVERFSGRTCEFLAASRILQPPEHVPSLDPHKTHFLCVARFHPHKGLDVLVEAIARIPHDERRRMQVRVFGGGPERGALLDLIAARDVAATMSVGGYLSAQEMAGYLRAADCLVIPSRIESVPVLLGDAAQAGLPIITTDVGDLGRLVRQFDVGTVVPAHDPDALARAMRLFSETGDRSASGASALTKYLSLDRSVETVLSRMVPFSWSSAE
jgi:glycosyltransferase involved in cell wall biosynthesis